MSEKYLVGPSHVTRWMDEINKGRMPALSGITLWGEGGLALFSQRLHDNIERQIQANKEIWLIVPDFRFGIEFFKDHLDFSATGMFINGYGTIKRNLITPSRDIILYENGLKILDHYVARYGSRIKLVFWCLASREYRNRLAGKYVSADGKYCHPLWNYQDILCRYRTNMIDIWPMTRDFDAFTTDQQGHPSQQAMAFLYHAFRLGDGEAAYTLTRQRYSDAMVALFGSTPLVTPSVETVDGVRVIEGKRGHLFLDGDTNRGLDQHYGRLKQGPDQIAAIEHLLVSRRTWMQSHGIEFVTLVAPDKNCVYFDRLPDAFPPSLERPGLQYVNLAEKVGIPVIYPLEAMQAARQAGSEVYDATDTHWNSAGAFVGYQALMTVLIKRGLNVRLVSAQDLVCQHPSRQGDLGNKMMPPRSAVTTRCTVADAKARLLFDNDIDNLAAIANRGRILIYECAAAEVTAIMFGDSFHIAMLPYLAESFRRLIFVHRSDLDYELVVQEKPDVVIVESVERFLISLPPEHRSMPTAEIVRVKLSRMSNAEREAALVSARKSESIFLDAPEVHFQLGLVLLSTGQYTSAINAFAQAIERRPGWVQAQRYRGLALYESGQFEQAVAVAAQFSGDAPLDLPAPASMNEANALSAIAAHSEWAYPHHHLGQIYLVAKKLTKAEAHQRKVVNLAPKSAEAWCRLGQILGAQGRAEDEAIAYREACKLNPSFLAAWKALGQNSLKRSDAAVATTAFEAALRLTPHDPELHTQLGVARMRSGDLMGAGKSFSEAIRLNPAYDKAYVQAGVIFKKLGRLADAAAAFRTGLSINPQNRGAAFELAIYLVSQTDFVEAEEVVTKGLQHHPKDIDMRLLLSRIYTHQKRYLFAKDILVDILTQVPDSIQAKNQLETISRILENT